MSEPLTVDERVWARWSRRAVTVPLYLGLGTLGLASLPLTILIALAIDALRRTGHLVTVRCALVLTLYLVCEAAGIVASCGLWVVDRLWPGATVDRTVVWNLRLQRVWARALFTGAIRVFGMRVDAMGARRCMGRGGRWTTVERTLETTRGNVKARTSGCVRVR